MNTSLTLNLSQYFFDPDGDDLKFTSTQPENISVQINNTNDVNRDVLVDQEGKIVSVNIWPNITSIDRGLYDIIVDVNKDDRFNSNIDVLNSNKTYAFYISYGGGGSGRAVLR